MFNVPSLFTEIRGSRLSWITHVQRMGDGKCIEEEVGEEKARWRPINLCFS